MLSTETPKQILLLAPDLLGESLSLQLTSNNKDIEVFVKSQLLKSRPSLVIYYLDNSEIPKSISTEIHRLQERWHPAPVLLILPLNTRLKSIDIFEFECPGIIQDPNIKTLNDSVKTLLEGGRVIKLKEDSNIYSRSQNKSYGIGQWLLYNGIQQINESLEYINIQLERPNNNYILSFLLLSRRRELKAAKKLLLLIWGPLEITIHPLIVKEKNGFNYKEPYKTSITLGNRSPQAVWQTIKNNLEKEIKLGLTNTTNSLMAIEILKKQVKKILLIELLNQLNILIENNRNTNSNLDLNIDTWIQYQIELRQQALRNTVGNFIRISYKGKKVAVSEQLICMVDLSESDDELPPYKLIVDPLMNNKPISIDGQILLIDDPRAFMNIQLLISNWLIRSADIICSEIVSACADWPEIRSIFLPRTYISTRELERFRNQLNSKNQLQNLFNKPIRIYESKRLFYQIKEGNINTVIQIEPRDEELVKLDWWQRQVTLLIEARDALAPQLQSLIKYTGDIMVVILTKVVGRSIGLIGRGIAQGMGRSISKS